MNKVDTEILLKAVEHSPASIIITDKNGNIEYVNQKFIDITGYSKSEIIGKNPKILKSNKQTDEYYKNMWLAISAGNEWRGEFCNIKKNGEEFWEMVSISSFKNENNEIIKFVAVKEDITVKKKMEKSIKMRDFSIQNAKDGMMWLDINGLITYSNTSYCNMLKYNDFEINKILTWFDIIPQETKILWLEYLEILKIKKSLTLEHYHVTKDKNIFPIETSLNYFILNGEEYIFIFTKDRTDNKKMEKQLKMSEEKFSNFFMFSPDAISITDIESSRFIEVNEAFEKLSGWKKEDIIGKTIIDLKLWKYPEKRNEILLLLNNNNGQFYNYEVEFNLKHDIPRTGLMAGRIIKYNGESNLLTITKDISERKIYENELKLAKEKAEESDRLKSSFLANMSHEIRTPMNAIIGFSDLLKDNSLKEDEKLSYVKIINDNCEDLMKLIDDIIDIAKMESGLFQIILNDYYIENIFSDIYDTYCKKIKDGISLVCQNRFKIKTMVKIDAYRLKQILVNLISNAVKFTESGFIEYGFHIKDDYLVFYVKDTGIGISSKDIDIIFERFRQVDGSQTRKYSGTGLGLNIVKNLVEKLNGQIWVESEKNKGSVFYFTIPYIPSNDNLNIDNIQNNEIKNYNWSKYSILIAEDVKPNFIYLEEILKKTKVNIIWATDGEKAVELYTLYKPNIVLMDLQMPVLNGLESLNKIRNIDNNAIIIAQTAYAMKDDKKICLDYGFDDYVSKPINKDLLLSKIDIYLKNINI